MSRNNTAPGSSKPSPDEDVRVTLRKDESMEVFRIIHEISDILNTGIHGPALGTCIRLIEDGGDPVALANLIKKWRSEKSAPTNGNST